MFNSYLYIYDPYKEMLTSVFGALVKNMKKKNYILINVLICLTNVAKTPVSRIYLYILSL